MNLYNYDVDNYADGNFGELVAHIAEACHEANRAYCESLGDTSQTAWEEAPEWQKQSAMLGVMFHIENPDAPASASHDNWMLVKQVEGWTYGPVKDPARRQHPCMVPFRELPAEQQVKDHIFRSTVHAQMEMMADTYISR